MSSGEHGILILCAIAIGLISAFAGWRAERPNTAPDHNAMNQNVMKEVGASTAGVM